MNVEIESLPNCIKSLRVELPPDKVNAARDAISRDFLHQARIPGYRPGKAPKAIIEKRFRKEIEEELTRKLVSESCASAIRDNKLNVISNPELEDLKLENGELKFTAKVITSPEFELPNYSGIAIKVPHAEVAEEEVNKAIDNLRDRFADFTDIEGRPLQMEDFVVLDYTPFVNCVPLKEAVAEAPSYLNPREDFWLKLAENSFFPGFTEQLVGLSKDEEKVVKITVPQDFPLESMRGVEIDFNVKVKELKQRNLPELNDEFAGKLIEGKTMEEVRAQVLEDLKAGKLRQIEESKRRQVTDFLATNVECELPTNFVRDEAQRIMDEIVRENQERGVQNDILEEHQAEIAENAKTSAKTRLKTTFILLRIAQKENLRISKAELEAEIANIGRRYGMTFEKAREVLEERRSLGRVEEELLVSKTLDFLISTASVSVESNP